MFSISDLKNRIVKANKVEVFFILILLSLLPILLNIFIQVPALLVTLNSTDKSSNLGGIIFFIPVPFCIVGTFIYLTVILTKVVENKNWNILYLLFLILFFYPINMLSSVFVFIVLISIYGLH